MDIDLKGIVIKLTKNIAKKIIPRNEKKNNNLLLIEVESVKEIERL